MNLKNKVLILTASALLVSGTAMAAEIEITDIVLKNDTVTISGVVDENGKKDMVLYAVSDVENPGKEDVSYAVQTKTDEDGFFEVTFNMNENHSLSDGKYKVYAICDDAEKAAEGYFEHIGINSRQIILSGFNSATTAADIEAVIDSNMQICRALGISDKADVSAEYLKNRPSGGYTDENFVSEYNSLVFLKVVNDSDNAEEVKEYFEEFGSVIINRDEKNEDFIAKVIFNNKKYENIGEINDEYGKAVILSLINNSQRNEILQNILDNSALLGIENSSALTEYKNSKEEKKAYISKALVVDASKTPFESEDDITDAIESAIKAYKKSTDSSNGSGSGGGGGGGASKGGSSYVTVSTPEVGQKLESKIENKTNFKDVSATFWGREAIEKLADEGIVKGDGENFRPDDKITREEFVTIAVNAFGLYNADAECDFDDVLDGAWYYKYVASAYENNIINGAGDGIFGTGKSITREDAAVILSRLLDGEGADPDFTDSNMISAYAKSGVGLMQSRNIITGMPDGSFAPKNNCTRAEAAMMFFKILSSEGVLKK